MSRCVAVVVTALLLAGCASTRGLVSLDASNDPRGYAEIALEGIEVWVIGPSSREDYGDGELVSYEQSDYATFDSPIWAGPGLYTISFGCPGRVHSYDNLADIRVRSAAKHVLSCSPDGTAKLERK